MFNQSDLQGEIANARRVDLLTQADGARLLSEARQRSPRGSRTRRLRRAVGYAIITLGERLEGSSQEARRDAPPSMPRSAPRTP